MKLCAIPFGVNAGEQMPVAGLLRLAYNLGAVRESMMSPLFQAGLNLTAIGMGVVFILLGLLVAIIQSMSAFCRIIEKALPQSAPAPGAGSKSPSHEIVSVISAAIAAHRKRR